MSSLDSDVETALFRVVQECLLNVHRYSNSATAAVTLCKKDDNIRLEVRDQGIGMHNTDDGTGLGVGLLGIRERIRQLDGKLQIISGDGQGTIVIATVSRRPRKETTETLSTVWALAPLSGSCPRRQECIARTCWHLPPSRLSDLYRITLIVRYPAFR